MKDHNNNIRFYEEILKIIPKVSCFSLPVMSADFSHGQVPSESREQQP